MCMIMMMICHSPQSNATKLHGCESTPTLQRRFATIATAPPMPRAATTAAERTSQRSWFAHTSITSWYGIEGKETAVWSDGCQRSPNSE